MYFQRHSNALFQVLDNKNFNTKHYDSIKMGKSIKMGFSCSSCVNFVSTRNHVLTTGTKRRFLFTRRSYTDFYGLSESLFSIRSPRVASGCVDRAQHRMPTINGKFRAIHYRYVSYIHGKKLRAARVSSIGRTTRMKRKRKRQAEDIEVQRRQIPALNKMANPIVVVVVVVLAVLFRVFATLTV